jgi:hypothetical protein
VTVLNSQSGELSDSLGATIALARRLNATLRAQHRNCCVCCALNTHTPTDQTLLPRACNVIPLSHHRDGKMVVSKVPWMLKIEEAPSITFSPHFLDGQPTRWTVETEQTPITSLPLLGAKGMTSLTIAKLLLLHIIIHIRHELTRLVNNLKHHHHNKHYTRKTSKPLKLH